ncbi:aldehyde ferredoxin oxidoreductase, partial [Candidatus Bathyarchaeota archaeon]|nr:aldehyde ferredoxin oxidoreductase [Candidatus Bathyarchaeota archaeon]
MIKGGYRLKIAVANLANREYKVQEVEEDFAIENIGGRGWGARIIYDSFSQRIDAFDPMNRLVIASGPLSGLLVPCSGKLSISAISPATGLYGDSNVGGGFAPTLKRAGFDALIVDGVAKEPTYILIEDGWVGFKDAKHLWGKFTMDTEAALKRDEGREASIIAIGPAGENLVKIACIGSDFGRQAGRTGMGAVMGHKRLKAV